MSTKMKVFATRNFISAHHRLAMFIDKSNAPATDYSSSRNYRKQPGGEDVKGDSMFDNRNA